MRLSLLLSIISFPFILCQSVYATTGEDCAKNNNDTERLTCYDSVFKTDQKIAETSLKTDEEEKGWVIEKETSKIDDSISYYLMLLSDEFIDESENEHGAIAIACLQKTTKIIFDAGENYLDDGGTYGRVTYRLDKEKAETTPMAVSNGNKALGLWSGSKSIPLIKKMFGHDKMIVQITPYQKGPVTMEFTIKGLEEAIKPLREACGW